LPGSSRPGWKGTPTVIGATSPDGTGEANDFAVINGEPVFSTYGVKNKIWIVTIPAKKVTLVLFPSDRS
jgi:hypothetical protein